MLVYEVSLGTAGLHSIRGAHFFPLKIARMELSNSE